MKTKTLNDLIGELLELQKLGMGEYSVIDENAGCPISFKIIKDFNEITIG